MANTLDLVRRHARDVARAAFVEAAADVYRCAFNPAPSALLQRELGRALSSDELRHYGHQYREELHALGSAAEVAALRVKAAKKSPPPAPAAPGPCVHVRTTARGADWVCLDCGGLFTVRPRPRRTPSERPHA